MNVNPAVEGNEVWAAKFKQPTIVQVRVPRYERRTVIVDSFAKTLTLMSERNECTIFQYISMIDDSHRASSLVSCFYIGMSYCDHGES
jgi:hypothetical protein